MPLFAEMYEAYFTTLERHATRLESAAANLKDEDRRAIMDIVAGLRRDLQALREQVDLCAEWG